MSSKKLIFSIVTPSYNQGYFIEDTIQSVLSQSGDFYIDYIIMDAESADDSLKIIKKYEKLLKSNCSIKKIGSLNFYIKKDNSFLWNRCLGVSYRWVSKRDGGQTDAINKGLKVAKGDILAYLNSDDLYIDGALENVSRVNWGKSDFVYGKGIWIVEDGKKLLDYPTFKPTKYSLVYQCTLCQPAVFFSAQVYKELGDFSTDYNFCFDYEYWLRAIHSNKKFLFVSSFLAKSRMYNENKSLSGGTVVVNEAERLRNKYWPETRSIVNKILLFLNRVTVDRKTTKQVGKLFRALKKIRVLYDISVLGQAHGSKLSRTGVARVVENLALGLTTSGKCDVVFCASQGNFFDCLQYLRSNPSLKNYSVSFRKGIFFDKVSNKFSTIIASKKCLFLKLFFKFFNIFRAFFFIIFRIKTRPICRKDLDNSDIYHSVYYDIPPQVRKTENIVKVQTIHDLMPIFLSEYFLPGVDCFIKKLINNLSNDDYVICVSNSTKSDLYKYKKDLNDNNVFVVYSGSSELFGRCEDVDVLKKMRKQYSIPDNAAYILSLSTLEPRKNIGLVISAFARLIKEQKIENLYLVLAGTKGWGIDEILIDVSENKSIKNKVIFTGHVPDQDLAPLYSGAIVFVFPSFYEGFGLPPLEAMQCGVPVITSNTSSLPEVVGDAGIAISPDDERGLCENILKLYKDKELQSKMSKKSLEQARKFSWNKCVSQTIDVYEKALGLL